MSTPKIWVDSGMVFAILGVMALNVTALNTYFGNDDYAPDQWWQNPRLFVWDGSQYILVAPSTFNTGDWLFNDGEGIAMRTLYMVFSLSAYVGMEAKWLAMGCDNVSYWQSTRPFMFFWPLNWTIEDDYLALTVRLEYQYGSWV